MDVIVFAYRGYSDSSGVPSEAVLKEDAHSIMKYVNEHLARYYVDNGGIFLLGRALGGAVAVEAYYQDEYNFMIDGLILENTFTSIPDMVDHNFYLIKYLKSLILRIEWRTIDIIPHIDAPLLFVTGKNDNIIPSIQTEQLYNAAG